MATTLMDLISNFTNCLFCFPSSPNLKINSRTLRLLRLLGEGGFSYVYLVQDTSTSALYALKKIRCPFGQESVALALKEVEAYSLFSGVTGGDFIIHSIDHQVKDEGGKVSGIGNSGEAGGQKTVYILLPYYRRGNLQDEINANLVNRTRFSERRLMKIMLGVCKGLKAMHHYKIPSGNGSASAARREAQTIRNQAANEDEDARRQARNKSRTMTASAQRSADEDGEAEQPLMPESAGGEITASQAKKKSGDAHAYAHRDIKPANIMLDDDDPSTSGSGDPKPILMDLGSIAPSPTPITSRSQALAVQDTAAEHSTMPYRAPELFDVKTGSVIDTKVDIWSLGCTMYACLIGKSPFEARSDETGGSLSICVLGGDWKWPDENAPKPKRQGTIVEGDGQAAGGDRRDKYPCEEVRDVVRKCLAVEASERPDIDELIELIRNVMKKIPDGETAQGDY
ncbi:Serine/threonine-protein kinase env7 [Lithohypha guttulata]|uniref:Serine/threonine-protein kinase env7 n=1 Tax=Lithohypha guttulata TaxID=1690604 RepID=UPI002DDEE37C|nr:Serine/threonine-protein kinase env7 [Lithohypha guttulata]KAK5099762.1 Serine/threonine-protein kinase env7 [Lithohypha guttulata]